LAARIAWDEIPAGIDAFDPENRIIIARTTKGKGVSFMEYDHRWHGMPPNKEQYERALAELQEGLRAWQN
jgi:transketolase